MIKKRIEQLRERMKEKGIDVLMIPTSDFHQSEYVADYFKERVFMSGFTGSAGTLAITLEEAGLWTDGRYFIQAENQLKDSGITLYRMGQSGVVDVNEFVITKTPESGKMAVDGRVLTCAMGEKFESELAKKGATLSWQEDLVDEVWKDRPALPHGKAFFLEEKYSGRSTASKLEWLRAKMSEKEADEILLSALDEIAWLLNIRGSDVLHTPVAISYVRVQMEQVLLYIDCAKVDVKLNSILKKDGIEIREYATFLSEVEKIENKKLWVDKNQANFAMVNQISTSNTLVNEASPIALEKAQKNKIEIENLRESHLEDGAAVSEFIFWLKQNVGKQEITELSAADYLAERRKAHGALDLSFTTISAYNANAAMMHYSPSIENPIYLQKSGMLLVDSGGQYLQGTTDITRTISLGETPELWKKYNTTVLKGMIGLARAKFLQGCTGLNLDILARGPVWQLDIDYQCGTGHGVGYLLGVHEGPQGVRWKSRKLESETALQEGMIVTDEPGIYEAGVCGIRIENELVVQKGQANFYGQFMKMENITFVPIDRDLILPELLSQEELTWLNHYHEEVYTKISPRVSEECATWLKEVCKPIQ